MSSLIITGSQMIWQVEQLQPLPEESPWKMRTSWR